MRPKGGCLPLNDTQKTRGVGGWGRGGLCGFRKASLSLEPRQSRSTQSDTRKSKRLHHHLLFVNFAYKLH